MTKKNRKKLHVQNRDKDFVVPASPLFSKRITLTDQVLIESSAVPGTSGEQRWYAGANGVFNSGNSTPLVPQNAIWTQYASMFTHYQVESWNVLFIPFKYETTTSTAGVAKVFAEPTYSIIDPDGVVSNGESFMLAYGNCKITKPYADHNRHVNYMNLAVQKQQNLIQLTNGSYAARAKYTDPTCIAMFGKAPDHKTTSVIGRFIFTYKYVFSGQLIPGQSLPKVIEHSDEPLETVSVTESDVTCDTVENLSRSQLISIIKG